MNLRAPQAAKHKQEGKLHEKREQEEEELQKPQRSTARSTQSPNTALRIQINYVYYVYFALQKANVTALQNFKN